jgi:uncharacterized protein YjbI with pentapeptide repeats/DNA-binding XRE family transcriptional regulator
MEMNMIGNKIAEARKKINISQAELAEHLFISPQAVGKWERGESIPDIITINKLAKILGVDLNYFSEDFQATTVAIPALESSAEPAVSQQKNKLNWDMSRGNWIDADFSGLSGLNEKFSSSNLRRCKFVGSDLSGLLLKSNHVDGCDFSDSNISGSRFQSAHLVNNLFNGCSLKASEFSSCHMKACNFSGADFSGATFKSSDFQKNITSNAVLNRTSFINSQLADIVFDGTLEDCYVENCAFSKVTFQNSKLINTFFKCRSLKHLRFVDCQADRMTYEFLKNGKADLSGITLTA